MSAALRAILLVDHGSRRPEANAQLEALAEQVRAREPGTLVVSAHLELAPPDIAEALARCAAAARATWWCCPGSWRRAATPRRTSRAPSRRRASDTPGCAFAIGEPLGLDAQLVEVALARIAGAREQAR